MTQEPEQGTASLEAGVKALVAKVGYKTHTAKDEEGTRYRFRGAKLCGWWNKLIAGREQSRWTEEDLYALEKGGYLIARAHVSMWQGEKDTYEIERFLEDELLKLPQSLLDELRETITNETGLKIPLAEIARDLE